jgi:hypothetical protein
MATFAELKQDVINLINRNDCTDALAASFVNLAQRRLLRTLRLPSLEKIQTVISGTTISTIFNSTTGAYSLPADFLELIYIYDNDRILERIPLRKFLEYSKNNSASGKPRYYTRVKNTFELMPKPQAAHEFYVVYAADDTTLVNNTDTNVLSLSCPDLLIYGAVLYAADYFNDSRKAQFEDVYNKIYMDVAALADATDAATADASVQPSFTYQSDLLN